MSACPSCLLPYEASGPAPRDALGWAPDDYAALCAMAGRQRAPAEWFAAVMFSESRMKPAAKNPLGYRGLIQFSEANLRGFGLTDAEVASFTSLSPVEQMPYVERFYAPWRPPAGWASRAQVYQATFLPATIAHKGSAPGVVLAQKTKACTAETRKTDAFCANAILSRDGSTITVADLDAALQRVTSASRWTVALAGIAAARGYSMPPQRSSSGAAIAALATALWWLFGSGCSS